MGVHGSRGHVRVNIPYVAEQYISRLNASPPLQKGCEQIEFKRCERHLLAIDQNPVAGNVDCQAAELYGLGLEI